jgi:hypothetical protein
MKLDIDREVAALRELSTGQLSERHAEPLRAGSVPTGTSLASIYPFGLFPREPLPPFGFFGIESSETISRGSITDQESSSAPTITRRGVRATKSR